MPFIGLERLREAYDLVLVGSGFGSLFFAHRAIQRRPDLRVLMIEWGERHDHPWQIEHGRNSEIDPRSTFRAADRKYWNFTVAFGGGANCWFAQTPRLHPNDFRTKSQYGIGEDWPITYEELERFYCDAEEIMQISGPADMGDIFPRSKPYPQPPHRFSTPDEIMKRAQPRQHFNMPTARARMATQTRSQCCATARCNLCPVDAKFTALNGFGDLIGKIDILTGARVRRFHIHNGVARDVVFTVGGRERQIRAEIFVLGANAIHSPAILLASGLNDPLIGVGLNEQLGAEFEVLLDGVDNFDGSTITTALNMSLYDGAFRRRHAGALLYFENRWKFGLRSEPGRWRQSLPVLITVENPPSAESRVRIDQDGEAIVSFGGEGEYCRAGLEAARASLENVLRPLPVEAILWRGERATESHLQGSLRMGETSQDSVVDANQIHHNARNLLVVGSAVFPTCPCANPSLTVAALSLRAAERLYGSAA